MEYKRPAGAYPLRDFHKVCRLCNSFQDALDVKIWLDLLEALWSYGGFKLRGSGFPHILAPLAAKLCVLEVRERVRGPLSPCQVWWGSDFTRPRGLPKTLSFLSVCLSVCLSVTLLNVRVCAPDFAMKALEYRNDFDAVG